MNESPAKERIEGFDVARALAILGMVLVHFGLVIAADGWKESWLATLLDVLDGRAAATFLVLAGLGIAVRSKEAWNLDFVRRSIFRRGVFLLIAGWLLLLIWPGDILRVYGVTMLVTPWLLRAPAAWLWGMMGFLVAGFLLLFSTLDYDQNWKWESMTYLNLWTISGQIRNLFYDGFRSIFPWSAFLVFGMWLGRFDWRSPQTAWLCLIAGGFGALVTELLSRVLVASFSTHTDEETARALVGTVSMPPLPVFLFAASTTAVAVIGGSVLLTRAFGVPVWVRALVATGQLAFTWYIAHLVIGLGGVLVLGLVETQPLEVALLVGAGFFVAATALSLAYKQRFKHGPLEWLMRAVADGRAKA
jgi:uncharacterized protein